jgi:putative transposase
MKRSRFSEEQIISILKEQEAGTATAKVCRRHGISPATFYKWKSKFGGMDVSEAKHLRALEDENAKVKKLLAETMLDIPVLSFAEGAVLKDITGKSGDARRETGGGNGTGRAVQCQPASGLRCGWDQQTGGALLLYPPG